MTDNLDTIKRRNTTNPSRELRGFTLIELVVVIAIIGILSAVVMASMGTSRAKARDARRASDMRQYQIALELYYERNNAYPNCANWVDFSCLQTALQGEYIATPPQGPGFVSGDAGIYSTDSGYHYDNFCRVPSVSNTQLYRLWSATENPYGGLSMWWSDNFVGSTTCTDPS